MNPKPKLDPMKLTPEQRDKLESYTQTQKQLETLQDIADISQEMLSVLDKQSEGTGETSKSIGALLMDMRDSLTALKDKEMPEMPDHAKPVVEAMAKLETALSEAIAKIDVKPVVKVDAPQVSVDSPTVSVDLKGVEKLFKTDIPKAFKEAIKAMPKVDIPKYPDRWDEVLKWLEDIDTASRMKPQPGSMKVSNLDEVAEGISANNPKYSAFNFDADDSAPIYIGMNEDPDADEDRLDWLIFKFTYSGANVTAIRKKTGQWSQRTGLF